MNVRMIAPTCLSLRDKSRGYSKNIKDLEVMKAGRGDERSVRTYCLASLVLVCLSQVIRKCSPRFC